MWNIILNGEYVKNIENGEITTAFYKHEAKTYSTWNDVQLAMFALVCLTQDYQITLEKA